MITLFLVCTGFCVYTYGLFPLLLWLRAVGRREDPIPDPDVWPSVSVVIPAHNEAANLPAKLASLAELNYPGDVLQFVIVSDGSSDGTVAQLEAAAASDPRIRFHHYASAAGKPTALNAAVALADGEILVFMDARQSISPDAITALVRRLGDRGVGAVSGELVMADESDGEAASVGLYWRYEKWIRQNESRLYSTTGATGALYAIRRMHFVDHPKDALLDDFETPVRLLKLGLRTVFEPRAIAYDHAENRASAEFHRKVRTLAGNYQSFRRHPWLFNPRRNPVWWQFLSHKVFRLLVPYAMAGAFIASLLGSGVFLNLMFLAQLSFYLTGLAGLFGRDNRVSAFVRVFVQLNAAAVVGAFRYLSGSASVRWRRT